MHRSGSLIRCVVSDPATWCPPPTARAGAGRARLRRQPPRLRAVRPVRPEPRADRAPARRGRRAARQPRHARRLARRAASRRGACWRASTSSSSAATTSPPATSKARSAKPSRRARCSTSIRPRRGRRSRRSICASGRCAPAPPRRTPISARCAATRWCSAPGPPAPARPGSRSPMRCRCSSARRSTASSCRGRRSRPASGSASCPATCARRSIRICARCTTRCYDLMDARIVERALQTNEIEIAPLAFMRGRTLSNAAIILDEAQNTTAMQMKMFLTRLGENSRMIVTGDPSQVDLPPGQTSGLHEAMRLLDGRRGHRPSRSSPPRTWFATSWSRASWRPTTRRRRAQARGPGNERARQPAAARGGRDGLAIDVLIQSRAMEGRAAGRRNRVEKP